MKLPEYVKTAINLLENANFEVFVVGGAVRDYLMGKTPHDFDLSTSAVPSEVKEVFKSYYTFDTGLIHGTVSVMINNKLLEITTYRYEEEYSDLRRPNRVHFIKNIEEDIFRRDFTINAICYNKNFLDLTGGLKDIEAKIIRAIGDPIKRLTEDPLRILRALRFASFLGFEIEEATKNALVNNFYLLDTVSLERINSEFSKLLLGENFLNIFIEFKPLIEKHILDFSVNIDFLKAVSLLDANLTLRLATLCVDLETSKVNQVLSRLKYPKKLIKSIVAIIKNYNIDLIADKIIILKILKVVDYDILASIIEIKKAINKVRSISTNNLEDFEYIYKSLNFKYLRINDLLINGNDLIAIGFNEGIEIKIVLEKILDDCINGLANDYEILINKAKEYLEESKLKE